MRDSFVTSVPIPTTKVGRIAKTPNSKEVTRNEN